MERMFSSTVYCGTFDSETFWRDKKFSKLPSINDKDMNNILSAMDELLFSFCDEDDVLITRYKMNKSHKDYLSGIGFNFLNNKLSLQDESNKNVEENSKCVFQLLDETKDSEYFKSLIPEGSTLSPFAILPYSNAVCNRYKMFFDAPSMDVIRNVNSKAYSTELKDRLDVKNISRFAFSSDEIKDIGKKLLKRGSLLIKDYFGVSGKGNLLVNSESIMERIVEYLRVQEKKGKKTEFIIEPFLDKELDFSCQLNIDKQGKTSIISVQKLINNDFAYLGSFTADKGFLDFIKSEGYFENMERIGHELFKDGYFGDVCVDSMLLKDREIVPWIEINARKSMSLIKHNLDKRLSKFGVNGNLTYLSLSSNSKAVSFDEVIEKMEKEELLFKPEKGQGILPLTANTLFINQSTEKDIYKGRLYFSIIAENEGKRKMLVQKTISFLDSLSFSILN